MTSTNFKEMREREREKKKRYQCRTIAPTSSQIEEDDVTLSTTQ